MRHERGCQRQPLSPMDQMNVEISIRKLNLNYDDEKVALLSLLQTEQLHFEDDIESAYGIFDEDQTLRGCGCASGNLLKCFAIDPVLRGENALGRLISSLVAERFALGHDRLFVITRPNNEAVFNNCGLFTTAKTESLVLLENTRDGAASYARTFYMPSDENKRVGAIVMNANPFTLGHRYLVECARKACDILHVFVVQEDRSLFSTEQRYRMVKDGTMDIDNVRVHYGGVYMISAITFPTYFLKENEDAAALQSELDITLFATRIAPELSISVRFAGNEPNDLVTARYNDAMRNLLPRYGIEFCEIERLEKNSTIVSASHVRKLLDNPEAINEVASYLPATTVEIIQEDPQWKLQK